MKRATQLLLVSSLMLATACGMVWGNTDVPEPVSDGGSGPDASPEAGPADSGPDSAIPDADDAGDAADAPAIAPPRPTSPLSTALVTSQKPTFRWALATGTTGGQVEICKDRPCDSILQTFTATGTAGSPPTALPRGIYFWRVRGVAGVDVGTTASPVWELRVGARSAAVDTSWGSVVDPNGDGFADLVVGASGANSNAGAAYLYVSSGTSGLSPSGTTLSSSGGGFGYSVGSAGDVDGDGFGDVIVGANALNGGVGAAYVYLGGPLGISSSASISLQGPGGANGAFGCAVASAGDVNRDGYADIIIGASGVNSSGAAYVYLGGPAGTSSSPATTLTGSSKSLFGASVASAGDVNGDGYGDVIVGADGLSSYSGAAYVYLGGPSGLGTTATTLASPAGGSFGISARGADDLNGDGYADLVVGAPGSASGGGSAYVYPGGQSGVSTNPTSVVVPPGTMGFGCTVSGAGDLNGDGVADLVIGSLAGSPPPQGVSYVYLGGASGLATTPTNIPDPVSISGFAGYNFIAVAGAGDVNADGLSDVATGWDNTNNGNGAAYVYLGTASGVATSPTTTLSGPAGTNVLFGKSIE